MLQQPILKICTLSKFRNRNNQVTEIKSMLTGKSTAVEHCAIKYSTKGDGTCTIFCTQTCPATTGRWGQKFRSHSVCCQESEWFKPHVSGPGRNMPHFQIISAITCELRNNSAITMGRVGNQAVTPPALAAQCLLDWVLPAECYLRETKGDLTETSVHLQSWQKQILGGNSIPFSRASSLAVWGGCTVEQMASCYGQQKFHFFPYIGILGCTAENGQEGYFPHPNKLQWSKGICTM